jgi:hypothetical protein
MHEVPGSEPIRVYHLNYIAASGGGRGISTEVSIFLTGLKDLAFFFYVRILFPDFATGLNKIFGGLYFLKKYYCIGTINLLENLTHT